MPGSGVLDEEGRPAVRVAGTLERLVSWLPDEWLIASGLADEPAPERDGFVPALARETAIGKFDQNLKVAQEGRSYVIGLSFTSESAEKAAKIVNIAAHLYVQDQVEDKTTATSRATSWLGDRIQDLRAEVKRAEDEVEAFRREHNLISTDGVPLREQELAELSKGMIGVRAELAESRAKLRLIRDLRANGGKDLDTGSRGRHQAA